MPLLVEQIIYTSFPGLGFTFLTSESIKIEIQQAFLQQIVHQYWDAYNPPEAGYRAAYLHQFSRKQTVFGWLYNDGKDDFGRFHIPYFIGYYLEELVNSAQLEQIFTCLEKGPLVLIERQEPPTHLQALTIPDSGNYQPARPGVKLPQESRQKIHHRLQQGKWLSFFLPAQTSNPEEKKSSQQPILPPNQVSPPAKKENKIETILQELAAKPIGIQGVVLLSPQGQLIASPIGMDRDSALIVGGTMLYLSKTILDELNWQEITTISVAAQEGHLLLSRCNLEIFLLVKTGKILTGLLEGEINRTIKKLQTAFAEMQLSHSPPIVAPESPQEGLPQVNEMLDDLLYQVELEKDEEVRYRGRRLDS
jgi:predicted regulator of Ras-like GTPase activity (Roadblock/LC7/MglB family)